MTAVPDLAAAVRAGDRRALARAVSLLEANDPAGAAVLAAVRRDRPAAVPAHLIGVTGSPGSGKSTLVDRLVGAYRAEGRSVAVVAVDPTSPYSGGAILGDRVRMTRWHDDPDVFVRSMATRGQLGGLAAATLRVAALFEASGFDRVLVETVGVGQSEVDVAAAADTTLLVLTPGGGDGVQAVKAGVMEVADVFAINKADLPGADRLRREIRAAQGLAPREPDAWRPPVLLATAATGAGTEDVVGALDAHRARLEAGDGTNVRRRRARAELAAAVRARAARALAGRGEAYLDGLLAGETTAEAAASAVLAGAEGDAPAR